MARRIFFSFHYERDAWRAGQVRNSNVVSAEDRNGFIDSAEWESIKKKGDAAVQNWIEEQLKNTSVTVVLIGAETASREWVQHEIVTSWNRGNGLVGVRIHNIKDHNQKIDLAGRNPFEDLKLPDGTVLSSVCKTYDWLTDDGRTNLGKWADEAADIRAEYKNGDTIARLQESTKANKSYGSAPAAVGFTPDRPGATTMPQPGDEEWLRERHPGLTVGGGILSGSIQFKAGYDAKINQFFPIEEGATVSTDAVILSGTFKIRIEPRANRSTSRLPALYVDGIEPADNRHFNPADKSACLCSPLEEDDFLQPELQFRIFLEQLVIPFLYGQVYFSSYGRWPWAEYAHGATGVLEAYAKIRDQKHAEECLRLLSQDPEWPMIRPALGQKPYIKGHIPCFCSSGDKFRRCHSAALKGALQLQRDLNALGIIITQTVRQGVR